MKMIKYYIEYVGQMTINNDYAVEIDEDRPICVDWFAEADLVIETDSKFVVNSGSLENITEAVIIKIYVGGYIIRPNAKKHEGRVLTVIANMGVGRWQVQLASNEHTTFLTLTSKERKIAYDLGYLINEHKIETFKDTLVVKAQAGGKYIFVVYNLSHEIVEHHLFADTAEYSSSQIILAENLRTVIGHTRITRFDVSGGAISFKESFVAVPEAFCVPNDEELPFAFLECVMFRDYANAKALLSFEISDEHLRNYFGEFEILLNNYLDKLNVVSIIQKDVKRFIETRNILFKIENGKISNIE